MRNPLTRITVIFVFVALLPVTFILYELNSLTENEKIVREIYRNQLDAILYSINQYSDDVISSWANRFNIALMEKNNLADTVQGIPSMLNQYPAVRYLYFNDLKNESVVFGSEDDDAKSKRIKDELDNLVKQHRARINQLIGYEQAGFRKMELMDTLHTDRPLPVFFVLNESTGWGLW
jgi:two-component system phosphate regulon sensor histidine kinase PhoR